MCRPLVPKPLQIEDLDGNDSRCSVQAPPKEYCGLHVFCFPGSAEKPLIAPCFGCLQCSEISDSTEEIRRTPDRGAVVAQIFRALRALFRKVLRYSLKKV